jgi:hypothetical protein
MRVRVIIPAVVSLAALAASSSAAEDALTMRTSPSVAFAPADLIVRATVEQDDDHRSLEIVAESLTFYRSSEVPLDGDRAARVTVVRFRNLPTGFYEVRAVLKGASGRELAVESASLVVSSGPRER